MAEKYNGAPAKYKQRFLECKSWGHTWKHVHDFHILRNTGGDIIQFTRQLSCSHCTTGRHDTYDRRMSLVSRQYIYPDGYQTSGETAIYQGLARTEFMRRLLVKQGDTLPVELQEELDAVSESA
jgi:hypothetical protein